jgi:hypothetical protein
VFFASKQPKIGGPPLLPTNICFSFKATPVLALRPILKIPPVWAYNPLLTAHLKPLDFWSGQARTATIPADIAQICNATRVLQDGRHQEWAAFKPLQNDQSCPAVHPNVVLVPVLKMIILIEP